MAVPYTFGSATSSIPLSQLDSNFATGITLGNTTVYLGNTTTTFGNVSLTNVTISSVSTAITPSQGGTGLVTIPANNVILGNGTSNVAVVAPGTSGNVLTSNGSTWTSSTISAASVSAAGSTTQVQYNNAGAFAGSANLTFNGTTLTAAGLSGPHDGTVGATTPNTGSFTTLAASSTVSGTGFSTYLASPPAIGSTAANTGAFTTLSASSTVTLSGGTANGVTYLNGSKVLTSGSALTFNGTNLFTTGNIYGGSGNANANILAYSNVANGGAGYSQFLFANTSSETRGFLSYSHAAEAILFGTSGTEGMRLTSTGLGIGTTSPAVKLDVAGASTTQVRVQMSGQADMRILSDTGYGALSLESNMPLLFRTNATERIRITGSGDVGIGTSSPAYKLDVSASSGVNTIRVVNTSTDTTSYGAQAYFRIDAGGNQIGGLKSTVKNLGGLSTPALYLTTAGAYPIAFGLNDAATPSMVLDSSGNLLVSQTSKSQTTVGAYLSATGETSGCMAASTNSTTQWNTYSTGAGAFRFYVGMGGTVYATSTTITAISDQRLKENIRDLDEGLATVMALKPRKFDWKDGKGQDIKNARGFIAQEFETVLPDMIEEWRDPAPEGEEPYKAINANLIPTLVKAIQEQQAIIESLKARLDAANL